MAGLSDNESKLPSTSRGQTSSVFRQGISTPAGEPERNILWHDDFYYFPIRCQWQSDACCSMDIGIVCRLFDFCIYMDTLWQSHSAVFTKCASKAGSKHGAGFGAGSHRDADS